MLNTFKKSKIFIFLLICICIILTTIIYGQYRYQILYSSQSKTFGATFMTMNNPFYEVVNNEIKKEIESKGDTLITLDPALDKNKQNEQIYYFIQEKVNAIFLTPIDYKAVEPALKKPKKLIFLLLLLMLLFIILNMYHARSFLIIMMLVYNVQKI